MNDHDCTGLLECWDHPKVNVWKSRPLGGWWTVWYKGESLGIREDTQEEAFIKAEARVRENLGTEN